MILYIIASIVLYILAKFFIIPYLKVWKLSLNPNCKRFFFPAAGFYKLLFNNAEKHGDIYYTVKQWMKEPTPP